jgi:hypothetical protein
MRVNKIDYVEPKSVWFLPLEPQRSCDEFPTDGPLVSAGSSKGV